MARIEITRHEWKKFRQMCCEGIHQDGKWKTGAEKDAVKHTIKEAFLLVLCV